MELVEQAILYVRTIGRRRVVEVACTTELVRTPDLTELIGWFAQDDTESLLRFDTLNLFFHPLPSGHFALGLIFPSQHGFFSFLQPPSSFFVRVLVVSPQTLLNYAGHPILLYRDLERRHKIPQFRRPPRRVHPLVASRRCSPFDRQAVLGLLRCFGALSIARLVQLSNASLCTFFASSIHPVGLIGALLNLFPVRFRTELTFATELFFSDRTPLRLIGVSGERRQLVEQADGLGVPLLLLRDGEMTLPRRKSGQVFVRDPWARLIHLVLRTENFDFFESHLKSDMTLNPTPSWTADFSELREIGENWLRDLGEDPPPQPLQATSLPISEAGRETPLALSSGNTVLLAKRTALKKELVVSPRATIAKHPRQRELLAQIDSDLARLLFGDSTRLPTLQHAWRELQQQLAWSEKERLREEFVSLIHSVLVKSRGSLPSAPPSRSVNLLDVLIIFLDE